MVRARVRKSAGAITRRWCATTGATFALTLVLFAGGSVCAVAAETPRLRFGHLTVEDGLSNPWIQAIVRDSHGFLWIGTQDGLNRYDGARFRVYRHDPPDPASLPSSVAAALLEDSQERLWVGSGWGNAGLALYDRGRDQFQRFLPHPGAPNGNNVRAMIEDGQGRLWLGTDNGIARFDPTPGVFTRFPLQPDARGGTPEAIVDALLEDGEGRLWVGTDRGLLLFDRERERYESWAAAGAMGSTVLESAEIADLYQERPGILWVATMGHGLVRVDVHAGRETRFVPDKKDPDSIAQSLVRRIAPAGNGRLYVGTDQGGLDVLDLASLSFSHHLPDQSDPTSLGSASIWSIFKDDQEIVWIGTYNAGVDKVSPFAQGFGQVSPHRFALSAPHVSAVLEDHLGNLWLGTDGGGLNTLDRSTGRITYYRHDSEDETTIGSDAVWALFEDRTHTLWVGCWNGGLGRLDPASGRVTRFLHDPTNPASIASDHVWRILELATGELLVVTHAGADLFDRGTGTFSRLSQRYREANGGVLYSAAEDLDGGLWLAGIGLTTRIDQRTGAVERYRNNPQEPEMEGTWAQVVLVDSAGNVWLGTDAGLQCVTPGTRKVRHYTTADGLSSNVVTSLAEDAAGNLWIGTSRGLGKLVDATRVPESPRFLRFDRHDGLAGNELARNAAFRGRTGELFFGGAGGLTFFDPDRVRTNTHVPPVVLTGLRLFNEPAEIGAPGSPLTKATSELTELRLSYKHTMVTFEFAALDLALPQKNHYAYKLEGFDREWNRVGTQRFATYTNLPAGTFLLRVRGSNNDGVWNEEGLSLKVVVTPPFWRTSWFIAGIALLLAGGLVAAHRLRVRQHLRIERELQRRVDAALADVKTLRGLLPICAWCKKVRDDGGYWSRIDEYVSRHSQAEFSHGICPDCAERFRGGMSSGDAGAR